MVYRLIGRAGLGLLAAAGLGAGIAGCNTVEGLGKDMSVAGRALSSSAERNKGTDSGTTDPTGATDSTAAGSAPRPLN